MKKQPEYSAERGKEQRVRCEGEDRRDEQTDFIAHTHNQDNRGADDADDVSFLQVLMNNERIMSFREINH